MGKNSVSKLYQYKFDSNTNAKMGINGEEYFFYLQN